MDEDFAARLPKYPVPETHGEPASELEWSPRSGRAANPIIVFLRVVGLLSVAISPALGCGLLTCGVPVLLVLVVVMVARDEHH